MIKIDEQREILIKVAQKHGVLLAQADEVWNLFEKKLVECIAEGQSKDEQGFHDITKLQTIHIDNFGKFTPNPKVIKQINNYIKRKNNGL